MPSQLRPAPEPDQVDMRRIVLIGTILFAVVTVVITLVPALREHSDGLWLRTALAGTVLGIIGQGVMRWQKAP